MGSEVIDRDFSGTNIKKPMDKMRAHAIIRAKDDPSGLSIINFNLPAFLHKSRHKDAFFILSMWATEPVRRNSLKFVKYPEQGKQALRLRADALLQHISKREDTCNEFIQSASLYINTAIETEMVVVQSGHLQRETA